jgi:hypothetical protein
LTRISVVFNAPEESGVYGLCTDDEWIYIGHGSNIRKALLAYLSGQMPGIRKWRPKYFVFEAVPYERRVERYTELLAHYRPICNQPGFTVGRWTSPDDDLRIPLRRAR